MLGELLAGVPALALAAHLTLGGQLRKHPVEVVGLDAHRLGDLGNGDTGLLAHQLEGLVGPGVTATAAPRPPGAPRGAAPATPVRAGLAAGPAAAAAATEQRRARGLEPADFLPQLPEALIDFSHCAV